jgi:hypothetical protein
MTIGVGQPVLISLLRWEWKSLIEKKSVQNLCSKKCRVNNLEEDATRMGWRAFSNDKIVQRALEYLNITITYSLRDNNCEHFATFCRYGFPFSMQVDRQLRSKSETLKRITQYAIQFRRKQF